MGCGKEVERACIRLVRLTNEVRMHGSTGLYVTCSLEGKKVPFRENGKNC